MQLYFQHIAQLVKRKAREEISSRLFFIKG